MNIHLENITIQHWMLAYSGLLIHLLLKLDKARKKRGFVFRVFVWNNLVSTLASMIIIPVCMVVCNDKSVAQHLPITTLTAPLLGYQSRSFFTAVMDFAKKKTGISDEDE